MNGLKLDNIDDKLCLLQTDKDAQLVPGQTGFKVVFLFHYG